MSRLKSKLKVLFSGYRPLVLALSFLAFTVIVVFAAVSYRVNNNTSQDINEFSDCKRVDNTSGHDLFVPTNTNGEWTAFYGHPPSGVSINACPPPPTTWVATQHVDNMFSELQCQFQAGFVYNVVACSTIPSFSPGGVCSSPGTSCAYWSGSSCDIYTCQ